MTTITFEENINVSNINSKMSVYDFVDVLVENGFFPKLEKLNENEITSEIRSAFLNSKQSTNRINI